MQFENRTNPVTIVAGFTRDLDEHRAALQTLVAHPDQVTVVLLPHSREELDRIRRELDTELMSGPDFIAYTWGESFGVIVVRLRADKETTAARLHDTYGDALEIKVGTRPYPTPAVVGNTCPALPEHVPVPGLELRFKAPVSVEAGRDGEATIVARNVGSTTIDHITGVSLPGYVVERGSDRVVSEPLGAVPTLGVGLRLAPGEQKEVPVRFSTANCTAEGGYALAQGTYGLVAIHNYGHEARVTMRSDEGVLTVTGR